MIINVFRPMHCICINSLYGSPFMINVNTKAYDSYITHLKQFFNQFAASPSCRHYLFTIVGTAPLLSSIQSMKMMNHIVMEMMKMNHMIIGKRNIG